MYVCMYVCMYVGEGEVTVGSVTNPRLCSLPSVHRAPMPSAGMYVGMYVFMYVCIYVCMYVLTNVWMYVCTY